MHTKTKMLPELRARLLMMAAVMVAAALLLSPRAQADELGDQLAVGRYVEGEAIVAYAGDDDLTAQSEAPFEVTPLMHVSPSSVGEVSAGFLTGQAEQTAVLSLVTSDSLTTEELLSLMADDPRIMFAEPNYVCALPSMSPTADYGAQDDQMCVSDLTSLQWGNWTTDSTLKIPLSASNPSINVPNFGSDQRGANMDKQVVVALIDTAVDFTHPDLVDVIYQFTPEQQDALDCGTWGFNAVDKGINARVFDEGSVAFGHGTHTAGILGAEWDGFGTSGVASDVKIVAIELADDQGEESLADALCAFDFVNRFNEQASEAERIKVTSNSWSEYMSSRALDAVVRELGERWGTVSFFSSGNDGKNNNYFEKTPSSLADNPYAIIVANTDQTDGLSDNSEYGDATVDLAAPGTAILSSTVPSRGSYFADATRADDALYIGFDGGDEPSVTISQLYQEDKPALYDDNAVVREDIGEVSSSVHFSGPNSLKIEIDPSYVVDTQGWTKTPLYDLLFDVDLTGTNIAEQLDGKGGLHFGIAGTMANGNNGFFNAVSTNAVGAITIKDLDKSGQSVEVTRPVLSSCEKGDSFSLSEWSAADFIITHDGFADPSLNDEADLNVVATKIEGDHLLIKLRVGIAEGGSTIYVDSLGIGSQTVSYEFASGTSMSTPAVAGAAAVLASRGYEGKELAALVRSMVRIPDEGALPVKSGGVFDFTVQGSPDGGDDEEEALAPAIMEVTVDGTTVTIVGENFGSDEGSVDLSRYVVGTDRTPVAATVTSWGPDNVTLELDSEFKGILCVVLTNAAGKYDMRFHFVDKGENVYEQDLPFDAAVGETNVFGDGWGDWETKGPLVGLGCKLYYLPCYEGKTHSESAYKCLRCFDLKTNTWTTLPDMPEWLKDVSAVMFEGKIVVEGAAMKVLDTGEPAAIPESEGSERVFVFDPETGEWSSASSEGMYLNQTIVNDGGQLKLIGGEKQDSAMPDIPFATVPVPVTSYDLGSGAGEELCDLPETVRNPSVAAKDGTMLIYNPLAINTSLIRVQDGQATLMKDALPEYFMAEAGETEVAIVFGPPMLYPYRAVLAPTTDGFVLVGPPAADGSSDTYVLKDGSSAFEPYDLRSSEDRVYAQAACTYRGRLFVIGSAWFEPEQRLFRATAMDVPEYPGDIPCDKDDPTPEPTPGPAPEPKPAPVLPKTSDPTVPTPVLVGIGLCGAAAVVAGVVLRRKNR